MQKKFIFCVFTVLIVSLSLTFYVYLNQEFKKVKITTKATTTSTKTTTLASTSRKMKTYKISTGKVLALKTPFKLGKEVSGKQKYDLIIKMMPEAGLGNRLFAYASVLRVALTNNRQLKVYPVIPEMQANLDISNTWISHFASSKYALYFVFF